MFINRFTVVFLHHSLNQPATFKYYTLNTNTSSIRYEKHCQKRSWGGNAYPPLY